MSKHTGTAGHRKTAAQAGTVPPPDTVQTIAVPLELWRSEPDEHDYPAALSYLGLITDPGTAARLVTKLRTAPVILHPAKDVLRAAGLALLPLDDLSVKRDVTKVIQGNRLSPVLILRGDFAAGVPAVIADGYHRVCASYHLSDNEPIPCRIIDGASS